MRFNSAFKGLISLSDNKIKAMWNTVKIETGTKCHPATMPSVLEKDNSVNNLIKLLMLSTVTFWN